ncbi:DUF1676 domain-containing protein Osi2 isoform 1-T1 [Glossina fuscipes fuscipes]
MLLAYVVWATKQFVVQSATNCTQCCTKRRKRKGKKICQSDKQTKDFIVLVEKKESKNKTTKISLLKLIITTTSVEATTKLNFTVFMELPIKALTSLTFVLILFIGQTSAEGLRLPDQSPGANAKSNENQSQPSQQIFFTPQQQQQYQQQFQQSPVDLGEARGRSSILSIFGLGQDNDPYLARSNSNCLSGDFSECFKTQALNSFDEIFYREQYPLTDFARIVRMPETQQRSLLREPFEYSEEPRSGDSDWDQMVKYALRRAERFIKSTALEVEVPEEYTEAGRYQARFIGSDIDSELDIIEDKHAPIIKRKKLKKMIIPMLLILKIFKLKLLLFLPFILGIVGLKKILGLAAIVLPGLFAYFKLCHPGSATGGGIFSGLFGNKNTFPEYSPQGVGSATYYHHHEHFDRPSHDHLYRPDPHFSKPYHDYYKNGASSNAVSFGDAAHEAAYSAYYGRSSDKKIESTQKT